MTRHPYKHNSERTAQSAIEIRNFKFYADKIDVAKCGLRFDTVDDANAALRTIANATFEPVTCPDPTSAVSGALAVIIHWGLRTDVYRHLARGPD